MYWNWGCISSAAFVSQDHLLSSRGKISGVSSMPVDVQSSSFSLSRTVLLARIGEGSRIDFLLSLFWSLCLSTMTIVIRDGILPLSIWNDSRDSSRNAITWANVFGGVNTRKGNEEIQSVSVFYSLALPVFHLSVVSLDKIWRAYSESWYCCLLNSMASKASW